MANSRVRPPHSRRQLIYKRYHAMLTRCTEDPERKEWKTYAGRGIFVCDRWRDSFENFYADMQERFDPSLSLDRIDNDGPYCPENCRWVTMQQNLENKQTNIRLSLREETKTIIEWARKLGVQPKTIRNRIKAGWPLEKVLTEPPSPSRGRPEATVTHDGMTMNFQEWSALTGIPDLLIRGRIKMGWTMAEIIASPAKRGWRKELLE